MLALPRANLPPVVRVAMVGAGILMLVSSPFITTKAASLFREEQEATTWPTARGRITHAEIREETTPRGSRYTPDVSYRFTVDGSAFVGNRITAEDGWSQELGLVQEQVRPYPVGAAVTVSYAPDDPATCMLKPGATIRTYLLAVIGVGIVPAGIALMLLARSP